MLSVQFVVRFFRRFFAYILVHRSELICVFVCMYRVFVRSDHVPPRVQSSKLLCMCVWVAVGNLFYFILFRVCVQFSYRIIRFTSMFHAVQFFSLHLCECVCAWLSSVAFFSLFESCLMFF